MSLSQIMSGACPDGFNRMCQARAGLMLYNRHDMYIGRSLELYGEFSEGEVELFRQTIKPGMLAVEVGANIGAHTLALSKLVGDQGRVFAFEPQRIVYQTLCANLALNSVLNVDCRCLAVGAEAGSLFVPPLDYNATNNFGGLGLGGYASGEPTQVITLDALNLPRCEFLKADVEGMELEVIKGAEATIRRCQPMLYIENDREEKSSALIRYIDSLEYDLYWHRPPLFNPSNFLKNPENVFGQIVSSNMFGIHKSVQAEIEGLPKVPVPV